MPLIAASTVQDTENTVLDSTEPTDTFGVSFAEFHSGDTELVELIQLQSSHCTFNLNTQDHQVPVLNLNKGSIVQE